MNHPMEMGDAENGSDYCNTYLYNYIKSSSPPLIWFTKRLLIFNFIMLLESKRKSSIVYGEFGNSILILARAICLRRSPMDVVYKVKDYRTLPILMFSLSVTQRRPIPDSAHICLYASPKRSPVQQYL